MTISGMTGFARAEGEHSGLRWVWEGKSVHGRALDLKFRTPSGYDGREPAARAAAQARFKRGSLQASLSLARSDEQSSGVRIDLALIEQLVAASEPFVASGRAAPPRWD